MDDLTSLEREIVELSIRLIQARYSVEEALLDQQWRRAVKMLIKERRDEKKQPFGNT